MSDADIHATGPPAAPRANASAEHTSQTVRAAPTRILVVEPDVDTRALLSTATGPAIFVASPDRARDARSTDRRGGRLQGLRITIALAEHADVNSTDACTPADIRRSMELSGRLHRRRARRARVRREAAIGRLCRRGRRALVYRIDEARAFLTESGVDADRLAPQVDGKFASAFIRARTPAAASSEACCGPACCTWWTI